MLNAPKVYESNDPYQVLDVTRDADEETNKKAYRQLVKHYHPDLNPDNPEAENAFKQVQQAYEAIVNSQGFSTSGLKVNGQHADYGLWAHQHPFESFYWAMKTYLSKKNS